MGDWLGFGDGFGSTGVISPSWIWNAAPIGTTTPSGNPGQPVTNAPWWQVLLQTGLGAFNIYEQNDLANEALQKNQSLTYDPRTGKPILGSFGLSGNTIVMAIVAIVVIALLFKLLK